MLAGVGQTECEDGQPDLLGASGRPPGELKHWLTVIVGSDLDVLPWHAVPVLNARPEDFAGGLLGCETRGELMRTSPAVRQLTSREHAAEESFPIPRDNILDSVNLDQVDACC
jgi:hypothetical protein